MTSRPEPASRHRRHRSPSRHRGIDGSAPGKSRGSLAQVQGGGQNERMALPDPFALRIAQIRSFMRLPPFRVLELTRAPDLATLVQRVLARIADDEDDAHAQVYVAPTFDGYRGFFQQLIDAVQRSVDTAADDLDELGCVMPALPELPPEDQAEPADWGQATAQYLSAVGDALPPEAGSLVLVLEPNETSSRAALGWAVGALAFWIESERSKVVVVDAGPAPLVPETDDAVEIRTVRVDFAVPPDEIEAEVLSELEAPDLDPSKAGALRLMAGAFASSAGRFDEAEGHLKRALTEAPDGPAGESPAGSEHANALYNLGNLYGRTGRNPEASEAFAAAAEIALDSDSTPLAAMALTNLGVSLYHEGRGHEALDSLGAARRLFTALDHRPGEAHVLDCTARIWVDSDPERARSFWREALELYDLITAPHLADVRISGRTDIEAKLARLDAAPGSD